MGERLDFLNGVNRLHAFYTENVRMLAHAYGLDDHDASTLLEQMGYHNVARSILRPPLVEVSADDLLGEARD
ncbi:hypothetical protein [Nigerium sp.]|uniref:hypothetical protein n=1 Tax=Nigerium sp. TaxID=2042655 RepID=UPI0032219491